MIHLTKACGRCEGTGRVPNPPIAGPWIRQHRKRAGLTLHALATQIGTSQNYLSNVESGKVPLSVNLWRNITRILERYRVANEGKD